MRADELPHAAWLEAVVRSTAELRPVCMAFAARTEDGRTMTAYCNADTEDMALMAHQIRSDILWTTLEENAGRIRDMLEEI